MPPINEGTFLRAGWVPNVAGGNVPDLSGNSKVGTPTASPGPAFETDPYFGTSLRTFANDSGFTFPGTLSVTTTGTWGCWYKLPTLTLPAGALSMFFSRTVGDYFYVWTTGVAYLGMGIYLGGVARTLNNATLPSRVGVWTLGMATYDGTYVRLYCDGALVSTSAAWGGAIDNWNAGTGAACYYIGGATYGVNGNVRAPFILNRCMSDSEISDYYRLSRSALWKTDWGCTISTSDEGGTVGQYISNSSFQCGDTVGRWRIETDTINGKTTKVLTCKTTGIVYLNRNVMQQEAGAAAFGELEIWFYKTDAGYVTVTLNNSGVNGVLANANELYCAIGEEIGVQRYVGGAWAANNFQTAAGYCPITTWTKATVRRTVAGVGTAYLNDQLIPVSVGANPFTDTTYLTSETTRFAMSTGCKISLGSIDGSNALVKRLKA